MKVLPRRVNLHWFAATTIYAIDLPSRCLNTDGPPENAFTIRSISISRRFKRTREFVDGKKASISIARPTVRGTMPENEEIGETHRLYICIYISIAMTRYSTTRWIRKESLKIRGEKNRWYQYSLISLHDRSLTADSFLVAWKYHKSTCNGRYFWWRNRWKRKRERERGKNGNSRVPGEKISFWSRESHKPSSRKRMRKRKR